MSLDDESILNILNSEDCSMKTHSFSNSFISEVQGKFGFPRYDHLKAGFDPKHIEKAEVHHKSRHCPLWPKTHQKKLSMEAEGKKIYSKTVLCVTPVMCKT